MSVAMGREDWYRRTTWSEDDQKQFFDRLKRSRGAYNKAQYLRIQASYLQQSGLHRDAIALLNMLLTDYPDESSQKTAALLQKAECLWAVGDGIASFEAYTEALASQRHYPNMISHVALSFAERFCDYDNGSYRETLVKELDGEIARLPILFPIDKVKYGTLMASLLSGLGSTKEAEKWQAVVTDARRRIAVEAIPVARVAQGAPNTKHSEPAAGTKGGKSDLSKDLDEIQRQLRPLLKEHGFRERGRTFSRNTDDGLTQVLHIWMANFDPPGAKHIPGLLPNYYGKFTINLGVFVPEVHKWAKSYPAPKSIREPDCCMRRSLGTLKTHYTDVWWDIRTDASFIDDLRQRLERTALPFFERAGDRESILQQCVDNSYDRSDFETPPRIVCAIILSERGDRSAARSLLTDHVRNSADHPGHVEYVQRLMQQMGLDS